MRCSRIVLFVQFRTRRPIRKRSYRIGRILIKGAERYEEFISFKRAASLQANLLWFDTDGIHAASEMLF